MINRTQELRGTIVSALSHIEGATYYRNAPADAQYPYRTFDLRRVATDHVRDDYDLTVDVWDRAADMKRADRIADEVEDALGRAVNLPQAGILPTFWKEERYPVDDDDRQLQHIQLHFTVENYVR